MKATEGKIGRVFILRLEDNDKLPHCLEAFAKEQNIQNAYVNFIAGIRTGNIITGPEDADARPIKTINVDIENTHESAAIGLIARDTAGEPILHIHGFFGRNGATVSGCLRNGVDVWVTGEAVVYEILDAVCIREAEEDTGFKLLRVGSVDTETAPTVLERVVSQASEKIDINDGYSHILHLFNSSIN